MKVTVCPRAAGVQVREVSSTVMKIERDGADPGLKGQPELREVSAEPSAGTFPGTF